MAPCKFVGNESPRSWIIFVIFFSDKLELQSRSAVEVLHSQLLDLLAKMLKDNHPANHSRILISIFKLIPLIERVNQIQSEIIGKFSTKFGKCQRSAKERWDFAIKFSCGKRQLCLSPLWVDIVFAFAINSLIMFSTKLSRKFYV